MPALQPKEVNLEGHVDEKGIAYIGIATLQPNGEYHVLARIGGCLCRVACRIRVDVKDQILDDLVENTPA